VRLLVFGAGGIVGRATVGEASRRGWPAVGLARAELDVTDAAAVGAALARHAPELVINAAGFTQVDRCESEPGRAFAVNATAVGELARACARAGARLVHLSTDYVFAGAGARPFREDDPTGPLSVYGASKLEGERRALAVPGTLLVRTSWVFGRGGANFVDTIAGRLRRGESPLRVVADQVGCPTYAPFLAKALLDLGESRAAGTVHYRNRESVSWFDFARAIAAELRAVGALGGLDAPETRIVPARSEEIVRPARRPAWSVLDVARFEALAGRPVEAWRDGLVLHLRAS
jgi:dTDP-4-dehydrorhamnose reductase